MKNGPLEDVYPIEHGDIRYSIALLVYQRVIGFAASSTSEIRAFFIETSGMSRYQQPARHQP